jgi:hypothetical protein
VVQIGPSSVSFSSANALRDIFNHTPKLSRPRGDAEFLEHFGQVNTASTRDGQLHFKRRKAIAGVYATPVVSNESTQAIMNGLVDKFMANLHEAATSEGWIDIWSQLRWLAADTMARLVYGKEAHLDLLGDKEGDREMMDYLLGSRSTEAETTTLGVLLTLWFPRELSTPGLKGIHAKHLDAGTAKLLERLAPGWFIMTSKMHIWAQEATKRAMQTRPDPGGNLYAAQFLAQNLKVNGKSEIVPSVKYIQSENFDNFSAG